MQYYPIIGEWDRQGDPGRWIAWSSSVDSTGDDPITGWFRVNGRRLSMLSSDAQGRPDQRFASGRIQRLQTFRSVDDGLWGTSPNPGDVVDVWGDGINKLASLGVINQGVYDSLFN